MSVICQVKSISSKNVRIPPAPPPFALTGFGWQATCLEGEGCLPKLRRSAGRLAPLWYIYFLELSNGGIYVGSTDDLRRRVVSHQRGHVVSTSKFLPLVLRSYVAVENEAMARKRERYFKSGS